MKYREHTYRVYRESRGVWIAVCRAAEIVTCGFFRKSAVTRMQDALDDRDGLWDEPADCRRCSAVLRGATCHVCQLRQSDGVCERCQHRTLGALYECECEPADERIDEQP